MLASWRSPRAVDSLFSTAATVQFVPVAPLCSSHFAVQFSVDHVLLATDTFTVNLAPNHTTSTAFAITNGSHTIGARIVNGFVWPDRTVNLAAGASFQDSLPLSCS